jgi:signal transduction histidine kinase
MGLGQVIKFWRRSPLQTNVGIVLAGLSLLLLIWFFVMGQIQREKTDANDKAKNYLISVNQLFSSHVGDTLARLDQILRLVKYQSETHAVDHVDIKEYFNTNLIAPLDLDFIYSYGVADQQGKFKNLSLPNSKAVDVSDRDYFQFHRQNAEASAYLNEPLVGRTHFRWSAPLTRRLNTAEGQFLGVASVSFDPNLLNDFYQELSIGTDGLTAVVGFDGGVRTLRYSGDKRNLEVNFKIQVTPEMRHVNNGYWVSDQLFDRKPRLYAFQRVPQQPLWVITGELVSDVQATSHSSVNSLIVFGVIASALIVGLILTWLYMVRQAQQANAILSSRNQEVEAANEKELELLNRLTQNEKLASLGQLSAGLAHEINNPIAYISANLSTLSQYIKIYETLLSQQREKLEAAKIDWQSLEKKLKFEFIQQDLGHLIEESLSGVVRVKGIVQDLKVFSRSDESSQWDTIDLNQSIRSALNIISNEIKNNTDLVFHLTDIPSVECIPSQINQVVLNLVVNASQAKKPDQRGRIEVRTGASELGNYIWLEVEDSGVGIADENLKKIFNPFFTTKSIGVGTGLGLSISFGIIERHRGRITVSSVVGYGTCFKVVLPLKRTDQSQALSDLPTV